MSILNFENIHNQSVADFAKEHGVGKNKLYGQLRESGIVNASNQPYNEYEDWFKVRQSQRVAIEMYDLSHKGQIEMKKLIDEIGVDNINNRRLDSFGYNSHDDPPDDGCIQLNI